MRVITFLLTLVLALAFIVLNFLGFNETLSQTQFIFISAAAEILLCFILGHFMYRTYANYKKAKQLNADLNVALGRPEKSRRKSKRQQESAEEVAQPKTEASTQPSNPPQPAPQEAAPVVTPVEERFSDDTTRFNAPVASESNNEQ